MQGLMFSQRCGLKSWFSELWRHAVITLFWKTLLSPFTLKTEATRSS